MSLNCTSNDWPYYRFRCNSIDDFISFLISSFLTRALSVPTYRISFNTVILQFSQYFWWKLRGVTRPGLVARIAVYDRRYNPVQCRLVELRRADPHHPSALRVPDQCEFGAGTRGEL
jgi:hypothetical protein